MNIFHICAALEFIACSISMSALALGWFGGASAYTPGIALISGLACALFLVAAEATKK